MAERIPKWMCQTCGGTGEIEDENHQQHPIQTGDLSDETWCLDCDGTGLREGGRDG